MNNDSENNYNVNSYNQQGGITAGQLNIGKQERHIDDELKTGLLQRLPDKKNIIRLTTIFGDQEALQLANEIMQYLKSQNYDTNGVSQAAYSSPVKGLHILPCKEGKIEIIIGVA